MTDFLSKVSGQITGTMIVGSFFPALFFLVVLSLVVLPLTPLPVSADLSAAVGGGHSWEEEGKAALIASLIVLTVAIVIFNLNRSLIRLYEGYPWKESWIGVFLIRRKQRRFDAITTVRKRAAKLRKEVRLCNTQVDLPDVIRVQREAARILNDSFPNDRGLVLPTDLGNVVRAFETYTSRLYGAPMVALWPRLRNVLKKDSARSIDSVKANFDFMLNTSFLSGVLALALTAVGFTWRNPLQSGVWQTWIAWDLALIAVWWFAYVAAIARATEWGDQVKACFDLYRRSLLDKLGYKQCHPADLTEERRIWRVVNQKLSLPDDPSPDIPYKTPPASLTVDPWTATVALAQTVTPADDKSVTVTAEVANNGPLAIPADRVVLREELPKGLSYVAGSASVNGAPAILLSLDPLEIDLGPLAYYESRTVVFQLKAQA